MLTECILVVDIYTHTLVARGVKYMRCSEILLNARSGSPGAQLMVWYSNTYR